MVCEFRSCCICYYLVLIIHSVLSVTVNEFYSFGVENGDTRFIRTTSNTELMFSNFSITNLLKNENVTAVSISISFGHGIDLRTEMFHPLISIFPLAKISGSVNSGDVFYRTTDNTALLNRAKEDIKQSNLQCDFNPRHLIIVTWVNYFYASSNSTIPGNTYQLIITTNETSTFAIILFGEINNPFPNELAHIEFLDLNSMNFNVLESINLPYVNDTAQAPNLTFNSNVPGTYIVKLSADSNVPCSQPPSCPGTQECKKILARLVCQKMINDNINPIPKACDTL